MITIVAKIRAKAGKEQELAALCMELAKKVRENEEGCLMYAPYVGIKDPGLIVFMEQYKDKEAIGVHGKTEYFIAGGEKMKDLTEGPSEIVLLKELT
ncbi:MAG: putative quinol monooxygenase [Bacillota bacterium]